MLKKVSKYFITRAEKRLGVKLDYTRKIASVSFGLLMRYNHIFKFLDPNTKVTKQAYHVARIRGALATDCGTCVEAEINLAKNSGLDDALIESVLSGGHLSDALSCVARLTDATVRDRLDEPEARKLVVEHYGEEGLIELSYAMNGAALLPGIKRAMGYATHCDVDLMRKTLNLENSK